MLPAQSYNAPSPSSSSDSSTDRPTPSAATDGAGDSITLPLPSPGRPALGPHRSGGFEVLNRGGSGSERGRGGEGNGAQPNEEGKGGGDPRARPFRIDTCVAAEPPPPAPAGINLVPPTPTSPKATDGFQLKPPPLRRKLSDTVLSAFRSASHALPSFPRRKSSLRSTASPDALSVSSSSSRSRSPSPGPSPEPATLSKLMSRLGSSSPVKLSIMNQTGLPLSFAYWPVRAENGERCVMQPFRGEGVIEQSLADVLVTGQGDTLSVEDTIVEAGKMRRPEKHGWRNGAQHEEGWIFVDLALPPRTPSSRPYLIHLQLYLRLSTTGSARAALGRFDLDSCTDQPMPSGHCGRVEVVRQPTLMSSIGVGPGSLSRSSTESTRVSPGIVDLVEADRKDIAVENGEVVEVRYVLTPDVAELRNVVDDSTKEGGSWFAPSKGIVVSSWVSVEGITLSLIMNKEAHYHEHYLHDEDDLPLRPPRPISFASLRTTNSNASLRTTKSSSTLRSVLKHPPHEHAMRTSHHVLDGFDYRSCFLHVRSGKEVLLERAVKINPLDGSTQVAFIGKGVVSTVDTPAVFHQDHSLTISYGFFDSGIARSKQMYVYASRKLSKWLGDLVSLDERVLELGRLNPELLAFLDRGKGDEIPAVARALPLVRVLLGLLSTFGVRGHRILSNLAMTQKDSIKSQLEMASLLFDIVDETKGEIRHQHSIVPGVGYEIFLIDILAFLSDNTSEIVVVELKSDGFPFTTDLYDESDPPKLTAISMVPTVEALAAALHNAKSSSPLAAREIEVGSAQDLSVPIGELLRRNRRLIIIDRVHELERETEDRWDRADSYTHDLYDTDDPLKILAALNVAYDDATSRAARKVTPLSTIYQLQATPTAQIVWEMSTYLVSSSTLTSVAQWADIGASLTYSDASSLLVWSKARMDRVTYPWLATKAFIEPGLVVFLNDFVDGCLVEHALEKTKERVNLFLLKRDAASSIAPTPSASSSRAGSTRNSIGPVDGLVVAKEEREGAEMLEQLKSVDGSEEDDEKTAEGA
ncbi:hypothetical protein JCM5296_000920 [Sporobolomyces johnsonii]